MKFKSSIIPVVLSAIFPGLGQIQLGDNRTGLGCLLFAIWGILSREAGGFAVTFLVWIYSIVHVVYLSQYITTGSKSIFLSRLWFIPIVGLAVTITVVYAVP